MMCRLGYRVAVILAAVALGAVPALAQGEGSLLEVGIDRPGDDLNCVFPVDDAMTCQATCQGNPDCAAFTWVRAGHITRPPFNGRPICCLKRVVPAPTPNDCCISGVKGLVAE
jgi:hypothetical protein